MRKLLFILSILAITLSVQAQTGNWYVQVGVFETKVDINYFSKIGSDIHYSKDGYGFHRYYKGLYETEEEAQKYMVKFREMGYNAYLKSKNEIENSCICGKIPPPQSLLNTIQNIFFDFDRSNLRSESKKQLRDLAGILKDFPEYKTVLRAHTDAKGSNSYNEALSLRRANSAKNYLVSRGIPSSRIKTETFGEGTPIAKNELDGGVDTEEGRQLNRRVEILILDKYGNVINEMVDEIVIPASLEI